MTSTSNPAAELIDLRDLDFMLWEWLRLDGFLKKSRYAAHDRDSIAAMLDMTHRLVSAEVAPHARLLVTVEPRVDGDKVWVPPEAIAAVRAIADTGLLATIFDEAVGGLQLPYLAHVAALGIQMAGSVGIAFYGMLTVGNAALIAAHGSPAQISAFVEPAVAGRASGTMCLSEPHAGSSLGEIRTLAVADGSDVLGQRFRIFGDKMWISGGDHVAADNIVHLVLAKVAVPGGRPAEGAKGISLFIVPKLLPGGVRNDVKATGINHKLGQRALPNLAMTFGGGDHEPDGRPGAIGWLVGDLGQGLSQMFHMMNEARIGVGLSGAILALRGYRLSLDYARERIQGRDRATGRPVPIIEHADVKRMLLAQKALAEGALALVLYSARLVDEQETALDPADRDAASRLLGLLTPVTKSFPSEFMQEALHHAIQILGGSGYTRDFDVEMLYRDNRLNPIHEGTTGIQAIDLVGRKLRRDGGAAFALLATRIDATLAAADGSEALRESAGEVRASFDRLSATVARLLTEPDDLRAAMDATPFLFAFGHVVVAWLWLDQMLCCLASPAGDDVDFYAGKMRAMRYFVEAELPRVNGWLQQVERASAVAADMPAAQF